MVVIKRKRNILGREKDNTGVLIKGAKVIRTDPKILLAMDSESNKKSALQQKNEVGVMEYAREMWAGSSSYETGGCYFDKQPEEQIIYGAPVKTLKRK